MYKYRNFYKFIKDLEKDQSHRYQNEFGSTYFDLVENEIIEDEKILGEFLQSHSKLSQRFDSLYERREVLIKLSILAVSNKQYFINCSEFASKKNPILIKEIYDPSDINNIEDGLNDKLNFFAGVLLSVDEHRMKRMVFRISKGRAITKFWDLEYTNNSTLSISSNQYSRKDKKIFIIFVKGEPEKMILSKIINIFDLFGVTRHKIPPAEEIKYIIDNIEDDIKEKFTILLEEHNSLKNYLSQKFGDRHRTSKYHMYELYLKKEKMIYVNLNKCQLSDNFAIGEIWITKKKLNLIDDTLKNIFKRDEIRLTANLLENEGCFSKNILPPTYIQTNDFLRGFQEIIDSYAIPRYQEINPTYFNIVTLPFFFGIMFGDIGHGFLLFLFGSYLFIFNSNINRKSQNTMSLIFKFRYLILMMGFFSIYCGLLYNKFFSIPLDAFGTCYENNLDNKGASKKEGCIYPFGFDPKWGISSNELSFNNSFKIKFSVIIGVIQMLLGLLLRGFNSIYFKRYSDFIFEFIPQFFFMSILFGYMDVLIYIKWMTDWKGREHQAPSILNIMMNIFLKKETLKDKPLWGGQESYEGKTIQEWFHLGILVFAFICIALMLFIKPILGNRKNKSQWNFQSLASQNIDSFLNENLIDYKNKEIRHKGYNYKSENQVTFCEILIHQIIEIIEFVLGAVSNTASYLRLWVLSLAHEQLSKVFFEKSILVGIHTKEIHFSIPLLLFLFIIFGSVTFVIIMCMNLMECFLNSLRLHW